MNSRTVRHQFFSLAALVLISVVAAPGPALAPVVASGSVLAAWLLTNRLYCHRLRARNISTERAREDRDVYLGALVVMASVVVSVTVLASASTWSLSWNLIASAGTSAESVASTLIVGLPIMLASVAVSSCIDRYVVIPWRNGIVGPYAFELPVGVKAVNSTQKAKRKIFTRIWIIHRVVATGVFAVGLFVLMLVVAREAGALLFNTRDPAALYTGAVPVALVGVAAVYLPYWGEAPSAIRMFFGNFRISVGDYVRVAHGEKGELTPALVWDVSTDHGYTLVLPDGSTQLVSLVDASRLSPMTRDVPSAQESWEAVVSAAGEIQDRSTSYIDTLTPRADWVVRGPRILALGSQALAGQTRGQLDPDEFGGHALPK